MPVNDICRSVGISSAPDTPWKSKSGGWEATKLRRVNERAFEYAQLKGMHTELALDNLAMKDLSAKKR